MASDIGLPQAMSSNRGPKTWASGRTLTEAQRDRKRKADRAGHKERRQNAQTRILQLEAMLQNLTREPPTEKILHLISEVERLEVENRTLLQCLELRTSRTEAPNDANTLLPLEGTDIFAYPESSTPNATFDDPSDPSHIASSSPEILEGADCVALSDCSRNIAARNHLESPIYDYDFDLEAMIHLQPTCSPKSQVAVENIKKNMLVPSSGMHEAGSLGSFTIVERCNLLLFDAHRLSTKDICTDDMANQNFLILATVEGWEVVESRLTLCPLWKILREVDGLIFWSSSVVERIVMLRMIHAMLICMVKSRTFDELPVWYRPRPAQQRFRHEAAMSYFAWPSFRERLVLSPDSILTNGFWNAFGRCFRFYWPYDARGVFEKDKWTGNYRFSGCFENYIREIRMWRMDLDFFSRFPLLIDDIFPQESIPLALCYSEEAPWVSTEPGTSNYEVLEETTPEECSGEQSAVFGPLSLPDPCRIPYLHPTSSVLR